MSSSFSRSLSQIVRQGIGPLAAAALFCAALQAQPVGQNAASAAAPDTLVLSNGDTLHGKMVSAVEGKVTFHTDSLGDVVIGWDKISELHTTGKFAVLDKSVKLRGKKSEGQIPQGTLDMTGQTGAVHADNAVAPAPIPVKNAEYVVDTPTLDKEMYHEPGFRSGWNGEATAGATVVTATQNQFTASGSIGMVRVVPSMSWLDPRNRTSADFSGSYGKITEPGSPTVKTAIYHVDAERDEYLSSRLFALAQTAFDHNFAQGLALQAVYGGGLGWTAFKKTNDELDLKATMQVESQAFINTPGAPATPTNHLMGSTFSASYTAKFKMMAFTQEVAYVPAYNAPKDFSANETNTLALPAYRNLSFSVGTLDSYLNDPPLTTTPPTKPNSFQFTMGLTYAIKSKY